MLAESIGEDSVQHTDASSLQFTTLRRDCLTLCWIHCPPAGRLHRHLDYPNPFSSYANFGCPKCFSMHYPLKFQQDAGQFVWFGRHSILEFVLPGGLSQTQLVAEVIFPTRSMQLHYHVEGLTRTHSQSLHYLKCVLWQSFTCFEREIPSV